MVANDHTLTIEGAAMFNHALSTHKVENEMDYFSAVEDWPNDDAGAAMTRTLEYNSATYYRFAALNLDMLFDNKHLACLDGNERKDVVKAFVRATLQSVPIARRNSMNGNVPPRYVLCVIREKGHPIQLINAFEEPIQSKNGIVKKSIEALKKEYETLKDTWGLDGVEIHMPEKKLSELLAEVEKHVN
jgi:CRISPR system Cascade subunit CasC